MTHRLHSLADGGQSAFEAIQNKDLPDAIDTESDQREDAPQGICCNKDVSGTHNRQDGRGGHLEDRICDGKDGVHIVEVLSLEVERLLHAADVCCAITRAVDAKQKPYQGEVYQQRRVQFDEK